MTDQHERKRPSRTRRACRSDEVAEAFDENYLAYQYCFVEFFIDHLSEVSRVFRGDLQAVILLALVGQKFMSAVRAAHAEGLDPQALPDARVSTNASRLADVTCIPRQTVRRKLAALEERGWILQNEDGSYRMVSTAQGTKARRDLADVDRRALRRVARLFADLEALVAAHQPDDVADDREQAQDGVPYRGAQNEHLQSTKM